MSGKLIILTGFPASGKDTVISKFTQRNPDYTLIVSHTSRPKRKGEIEGVHHHFVNHDKFEKLIQKDHFLEYVQTGLYYKGTSKKEFNSVLKGNNLIWRIELTRFLAFEQTIMDKFDPEISRKIISNSTKILIKPESKKIAIDRYKERDKKSDLNDFLIRWNFEYKMYKENLHKFPYVIVNKQGKIEETIREIEGVVNSY